MAYLLSQLWFCLLLAWMLGNIVGWLLRGGCTQHIKRVEENWRSRYLELENEKESNFKKLKKLMVISHDRDRLSDQLKTFQGIEYSNSKLKARLAKAEKETKESQKTLKVRAQNIVGLQNSVANSKKIISSKEEALKELTRKLIDSTDQAKTYKSQLLEMNARHEELNTQKDESLKVLTVKLNESSAANATLKAQLKEANTKMSSGLEKAKLLAAKEVEMKQQEIKAVSTELSQAREQMQVCRTQLEEADVLNNSLTEKLSAGNARMDLLANEFAKMASQLKEAKSEVVKRKESSKELEIVGVKLKETEAKLSKALDEKAQQKEKIDKISVKLESSRSKLVDAHKLLQKKEQQSNQSQASIKAIESKNDSSGGELNGKQHGMQKPVSKRTDSDHDDAESDLAFSERSVPQSNAIEIELKQSKHKIKKLEAESVKSQTRLQKLELQVKKFRRAETETKDDVGEDDLNHSNEVKNINLLDTGKTKNILVNEEKSTPKELVEVNCEIEQIRGIGPGHGMRLRKLGISTNQDLLHTVSSSKDIRSIADKLSKKPSEILSWKKMADFLRIKGVSAEFAKLLELSSINSTQDIADSNSTVLAEKMSRARKKEHRIHNMPDDDEINGWISHARKIETHDNEYSKR